DSTTPAYARAIFMRLDKIEQSLETIKSILTRDMRSDDPEIEVFSRPLKTPAELEELSEKLMDRSHRKKVVDEVGPSMTESNVAATDGSRSPLLFSESADSE
ncbi:Hypothetical protein SMAX5B_018889, partial [Scophthalmus maximus]